MVLHCSSKQVTEFVSWIQQQDFYENTTIVISGDHLTMDSDFCENIDPDYTRTVYNVIINSDPAAAGEKQKFHHHGHVPDHHRKSRSYH